MRYHLTDHRGVLVSGPHLITDRKAGLPAGAVVTDETPPTPGEGEVVMHAGGGKWCAAQSPVIAPIVKVGPDRLHRGQFATDLLTAAENDAWIALVDGAEQTPVASRTATQKVIVRAWRHFTLHEYIERDNVHTQTAVMALYVWGVLGPVYDDQSGVAPTEAELVAIARADRIGKFLRPA